MSVSKLTIAIKDVRNGGCEPLRRWMLHIKPSLGVWTNLNIELDTLKKNNVINCAFSAQSGSSSLNNIINCAFSAQSGSRVYSYYQLRLFSTIRVELFKQYYQLRFFSTIREPTAILRSCKWSMLGLVHPNFKSTTQGRTPVPSMEPSHCIMSNCIHKQPCGGILKIHPG